MIYLLCICWSALELSCRYCRQFKVKDIFIYYAFTSHYNNQLHASRSVDYEHTRFCLLLSTHVLTEDVVFREVTADHQLYTRRLFTKTNRLPRWAECFFPTNLSRSVYILEDSVVDPVTKSFTTYTWNLNHTTLMVCTEYCHLQYELDVRWTLYCHCTKA